MILRPVARSVAMIARSHVIRMTPMLSVTGTPSVPLAAGSKHSLAAQF